MAKAHDVYDDKTLGERQEFFARILPLLLIHIHAKGYDIRIGHCMRCRNCYVGKKHSVHKEKLAIDLNITKAPAPGERPVLLTDKEAEAVHNEFHDYWDSLGGAPRIKGDLNHYSVSYQNRW